MRADRLRYLPASLGLGLFVGDVLTLWLRSELTVARAAASALVALVAYAAARWAVARWPTARSRRHGRGR